MKTNYKLLAVCIFIPLAVGGISGFITSNSMESFKMINKPLLSPPGFLFPIVWTILYILMGISSYLVISSEKNKTRVKEALFTYGLQLVFNFFWPIIFFHLEWYMFAFVWLVLLWVFIFNTIISFYEISKSAAYLLVPYLLWVTFAGYLNLGIYLLN